MLHESAAKQQEIRWATGNASCAAIRRGRISKASARDLRGGK
jgi:hypothetical protein